MSLQPIIDIVAKHLAVQAAQSMTDADEDCDVESQCRYRLERNGKVLMCAVGVLLDGHVDVTQLEGLPASDIFQDDTKTGFSGALAAVHDAAADRLKELVPGMSTEHLGRYLDSIQTYHDADDNFIFPGRHSATLPRYADVLKLNLTEEEREVRIRADLEHRVNHVAAIIADEQEQQFQADQFLNTADELETEQ